MSADYRRGYADGTIATLETLMRVLAPALDMKPIAEAIEKIRRTVEEATPEQLRAMALARAENEDPSADAFGEGITTGRGSPP